MKTIEMNNLRKVALVILSVIFIASYAIASGQGEMKKNTISYELSKGSVDIEYVSIQDQSETIMLTLETVEPANFVFSKNMNVNGTHLNKGEYEVSLIELEDGLGFNFHSLDDKKRSDVQVTLEGKKSSYSEWLDYSIRVIENDKLAGEFNWKNKQYTFSMEIALSNTIFSYLEKEEEENTSDWVDYYQAAIYAYKNNIDLNDSYQWAQKALKTDNNEHTQKLNSMYINALSQENEAQQLSALQD